MPEQIVAEAGVIKTTEWNGKPMKEIAIRFQSGEEANWFTGAATNVPQPGDKLDGHIEPSEYGNKWKRAQKEFGGAPGGSKGSGGMSPEREKKIVRQHSQATAIAYVAATGKTLANIEELKPIIDWFDTDVFGAKAEDPSPSLDDALVTPPDDTPPF